MVFVDGHFAPALSAIGGLPGGVHIGSLADALAQTLKRSRPPSARPATARPPPRSTPRWPPTAPGSAWVAASPWSRRSTSSSSVPPPPTSTCATSSSPRPARRRPIVEHYPAGAAGSTLTTAVTRVLAAQDSHITHLKLQQEAPEAIHLATIEAEQARGAVFASHSLSFGARLARNDIRTRLAGEGAEALLNGLYHADGRRHVDHHTRIDHAAPAGHQPRVLTAACSTAARAACSPAASWSPRTPSAPTPCSAATTCCCPAWPRPTPAPSSRSTPTTSSAPHGATVGQLDEDALFYLRSRGVDAVHARQLLTYAFAAEVLERIAHAPLRALGRAALLERLPDGARLEELL